MTLKSWLKVGLTVVVSLAASMVGQAQTPGELKPGDMAPNFTVKGSDGKSHSLSDHKGKSAVVLAWFPKAFTGG